jgi:hypothetical protein
LALPGLRGYNSDEAGDARNVRPAPDHQRGATLTVADQNPTAPTPDWKPQVAVLEQIARNTEQVLLRIETRLDRIDGRFETRLDRIDGRMADDFKFLVRLIFTLGVLMLGGFAAVLGVIARAQHWI